MHYCPKCGNKLIQYDRLNGKYVGETRICVNCRTAQMWESVTAFVPHWEPFSYALAIEEAVSAGIIRREMASL